MNNNHFRRLLGIFIRIAPVLLVLILTVVSLQNIWLTTSAYRKSRIDFIAYELISNDTYTNLAQDAQISQIVLVPAKSFDTFGIRVSNNEQSLDCNISLQILSGYDVISTSEQKCAEIKANDFLLFSFAPISLNEAADLTFKITLSGIDSQNLTIFRNTAGKGALTINSQAQDGSLVYLLGTKELFKVNQGVMLWAVFGIIASLAAGFFIWSMIYKRKNLLTIFCLLSVGLVYVFIVPPFHYLDEYDHFLRAVELSYFDFSSAKYGSFQINPEYNSVANRTVWLSDSISGGFYSEISDVISVRAVSERGLNVTSSAASAIPIAHIVPAGVIGISRTLAVPIIAQLYLTRIVTLLLFVAIILFAIYLSPKYYLLFISLSLLPTVISQAGALSLDSLITAGSIVALSVVLTEKLCNKYELLAITVVGVLLSLLKITYLPLGALVVYSAFRTRMTVSKSLLTAGLFSIMMLCVFIAWNQYLATTSEPDPRLHETNPSLQLQNVVNDPAKYLAVIGSSFIAQSKDIAIGSSQRIYTNYGIQDSKTSTIVFLLSAIAFFILTTQIRHTVSIDRKILIILSVVATILGIQFAMYLYTIDVGAVAFTVQPRYYSFLWPMMVILGVSILKQSNASYSPAFMRTLYVSIYLLSLSTALVTFFAFVLYM